MATMSHVPVSARQWLHTVGKVRGTIHWRGRSNFTVLMALLGRVLKQSFCHVSGHIIVVGVAGQDLTRIKMNAGLCAWEVVGVVSTVVTDCLDVDALAHFTSNTKWFGSNGGGVQADHAHQDCCRSRRRAHVSAYNHAGVWADKPIAGGI